MARPAKDWITSHGITHLKKRAYLAAFAKTGTHLRAAKASRVHRRSHYRWMEEDPAYRAAFEEAKADAADSLESEAIRRARDGWYEPVYQNGRKVGVVKKFSDTLLIFTLKGLLPEKYKDRHEHTGAGGGPIATTAIDPATLSTETLQRILAEARQKA